MKIRISQLRQKLDDYKLPLEQLAARALRVKPGDIRAAKLVRKSVDARDKGDVHFTLTLDVETARPVRLPRNAAEIMASDDSAPPSARDDSSRLNQWREESIPERRQQETTPPLVVGMGPAGLFAAGEVLDVDGDCGGYNLQWAWSSALLAAEGIEAVLDR